MSEVEKLKKEIEVLKSELESERECYLKVDDSFFYAKVRELDLLKENKNLQYELKRMQEENARLEKENADIQSSHMKLYNDTKDEIRELKLERQQDCIRYADMRTAFLKAVDELAMLRKQFGVGQ